MAALFDLDGVVFDTERQYDIYWGEQGRIWHPEIPEFNKVIKGQTLERIHKGYFASLNETEWRGIVDGLNRFEAEMAYDYIPGVLGFIADLRKHGVKTAVVTSSNDAKMGNVYRIHPGFKGLFDAIVTANQIIRSKPDPECFLLGAKACGAVPADSFVFEDSFHGLEAGRAAGMRVVGLATTNPREAIEGLADRVIPDFTGFRFEDLLSV